MDGFKPDRESLGELDEEDWPYGMGGKRDDPWHKTIAIPLITYGGEVYTLYTFSTHSFFGRKAAYELLRQYAAQGHKYPDCYPLTELGAGMNPTKSYGEISSPTLEIVDWIGRPQLALPATTMQAAVVEEPGKVPPSSSSLSRGDLDDEIPF